MTDWDSAELSSFFHLWMQTNFYKDMATNSHNVQQKLMKLTFSQTYEINISQDYEINIFASLGYTC